MSGKTLWMSLAFAAALGLSMGCGDGKKDDSKKDDKKGADNKGSGGSGGSGGTTPAAAATPEDAVKGMFDAMKAGDFDTALSYFPKAHGDAMRNVVKGMDDANGGVKEIGDAMKAKFGAEGPKAPFPDIKSEMKKDGESVVSYTITKKEEKSADKIAVTIKTVKKKDGMETTEEKTGLAIKEADGWKLLPPNMPEDPKLVEAQAGAMTKFAAAFKKIAKDINDGTVKTKEDATEAFGKAMIGG